MACGSEEEGFKGPRCQTSLGWGLGIVSRVWFQVAPSILNLPFD